MPAPSWENLDDFLDPADFAVEVVIQPQEGAARKPFTGIFDDAYLNAQLGEFDMDTNKPRVLCKETDLAAVRRGDNAVVDGKLYDVLSEPQSTGDGMALLILSEL